MGTLTMSEQERKRVGIMVSVKAGELSLTEASAVLGLGYRQTKRIWRRYQDHGDAGLVHRLRGQPGQRRKPPELRAKILARYAERYPDFGPTLAAEYLAKEKLLVDHETLRRWLLAENQRTVRRRRQRHRQWRERKPCLGAMVQLDGSHHDWFEGRRDKCVLMVMVDDATSRVWAQFCEEETTHASYDVLAGWTNKYGLPQSLYVDRASIYRCEGLGSIAEQIRGPGAANPVWAGDAAVERGTNPGQQPASQGARGTDQRGAARPAGQGPATEWDQRYGKKPTPI